MLTFGVLGPLLVRSGERNLAIGSRTQRLLLTALLAQAGSVVSADRLVEILWGDDAPATAVPSLHTYVSRLRALLHADGEAALSTRPPGYLLQVTPAQTDVGRFEVLVGEAGRVFPGDPAAALAHLDEALALWRGTAYAEFADEDFARPEASRLAELRLGAVEQRFEAGLALGHHAELVGALGAYTEEQPLRERPCGQLMLALYRCGRQAEALAAFRAFRQRLDDELAVEPSAALRALETAILRQDPDLDPRPITGTSPGTRPPDAAETGMGRGGAGVDGPGGTAAAAPEQGTVPEETSSFIGREDELTAIQVALDTNRLVTLTGPGGVGKTRLAVQTAAGAQGYPDGVRWCELGTITDPAAVGHAVAAAIGARQQPGSDITESVRAYLATRSLLLVVDNCEHVLDAAAALLTALLRSCPRLTVLATSRTPLGVAGEQIQPIAPLPVPGDDTDPAGSASVLLFADRARAVRPGLDLTGPNLDHVAQVCRRLDGLPLAIELAAARMRALNPADLADRLGDGLRLLAARSMAVERHRTLRAVVDWSYALLSPAEQRLFDRLSVFAGGFTLAAAEQVCGEPDLVDTLAALVDGSLVTAGASAGQVRYGMLATLRAYAAEKLAERGEAQALHDTHAAYFAATAERFGATMRGPDEGRCVAVLDADMANLRAAHRWAVERRDTGLAMRISAGLYHYVVYRFHDEVVSWGETVLGLPGAAAHPLYPVVCGAVGEGFTLRGDQRRALAVAESALAGAADPQGAPCLPVLKVLAAVALYEGRLDDCSRWAQEQTRLARVHGDAWREGEGLLFHGLARTYAGDVAAGLTIAQENLRVTTRLGNPSLLAWAKYCQAEALCGGDPARARRLYAEAVALADSVAGTFTATIAQVGLAALLARSGEDAAALSAFRQCVDRWHRLQVWHHQWTTLRNLVPLLVRVGAGEAAATLLGALDAADTAAYGSDAASLATAAADLTATLGVTAYTEAVDAGAALGPDGTVAFALSAVDTALSQAPHSGSR
ncbi:AfsR/SARP family transcriptional regulator [Catellatospora coxensis]|uniref:SARP family transcriptional regulator n=1 Tax=Catellatospora coxensis TaxID=310354 RepID=A0A8J3KZW0_9ACTN|nr:BTAD domain-containing putative transcriptional regulator [Catellatospora coxensis]GIG04155.1 SARP family transcriptional regulator [Catellatospora coxensis]